jgi:class 3 adenylate cyclase
MPEYRNPKSAFVKKKDGKGRTFLVLEKSDLDRFDISILGLGDLKRTSRPVEAMAAVFDLEGFTNFCKQIDPHLSLPNFLSRFLDWLLQELKNQTVKTEYPEGSELWHPLPFFMKFLGDGLLVLWDCEEMHPVAIRNIIVSLRVICNRYKQMLLKELSALVVDPPGALRCGIARGTVFSVGDSSDYVGSCINMAARLQKLPGVSFAVNQRGVAIHEEDVATFYKNDILVQKVSIRGIGENELVCILKSDAAKMSKEDRKLYRDP